jgi:hypothetical protein
MAVRERARLGAVALGAGAAVLARAGTRRVAEDVNSADISVSGTPNFFVNGLRHYGAYDIATLSAAVKAARAREFVRAPA